MNYIEKQMLKQANKIASLGKILLTGLNHVVLYCVGEKPEM